MLKQIYIFFLFRISCFKLDIVDENYISPENLNRPNSYTEIECLALNHDSSWLVTVERRDDQLTTPEVKLKFWRYDQINNK
jgi:NET1-associated nuclear protein 1 (U3 small nucleolar RNA-associated protein 17)